MNKSKIVWVIISILIAGLSIYAVASQNSEFSIQMFSEFVLNANKLWLAMGIVAMFGFIFFESIALLRVMKSLGYKRKVKQGILYGAADVYFSAITPSASGGQPASAYFMMMDDIPGTAVTAALLINLVMYTLALLTLGVVCMIVDFNMVLQFSIVSRVLIIVGCVILIGLGIIFYLLLSRAELLYKFCDCVIMFFEKLHLMKKGEKKRMKLKKTVEEYRQCADVVMGKWKMLLELYFWNLMQRISQLAVSGMIFMSMGYGVRKALKVCVMQCFVAVGSNSIPIPGSMGVADYIMLDGFNQIVGEANSTSMELLCRGMTFYGCMITSSIIVVVGFIIRRMRKREC